MVTKVQLQICLLLGLVYSSKAQLMCPSFTIADLGSTTDLSTEGLLPRSLATAAEVSIGVPVKINDYRILCDASGSSRDTSSYVSVLVEFQCSLDGGTGNLAQCDGMTNITRQYQYRCSRNNVWENAAVVQTLNPTATFQTEPTNQCWLCADPAEFNSSPIDQDTHCFQCQNTACNQGQSSCYIENFSEQCCNFYLEDECMTECPAPLVPNNTTFDCGCTPLNLANGSVSYSIGLAIGSTATHVCDFGYQLSGEDMQNCTTAGWTTGQEATCELIQCPDLSIENGMAVLTSGDRTLNSGVTYSCFDGYRLRGNSERFCQMDSMWNGTDPMCELIQCSQLSIENGDVDIVPIDRTLNSRSTYSCSDGYMLQGISERFCQIDSTWNGTDPVCELIQCSQLSIENGEVVTVPTNRTLNSRATYSCFDRYRLQGISERSCEMNSTWSGTDPVCELIKCPMLAIDDGSVAIVPNDRTLNSTATYSCSGGYSLRGIGERFCQMNGTWSGTDPECELIQCPPLDIDNGTVTIEPSDRSSSSVATYTCSVGYSLQGNRERICQVNGTWSGTDSECVQLIQCPVLVIENGDVVIMPNNRSFNSRATYSCYDGYSLQGNNERLCQLNSTWSGANPQCELIQCPGLIIDYGTVVIVPNDHSVNSRATYSCSDNYRLEGNSERICQLDGTWSNTDPLCEEIQCPEMIIENAEVVYIPDSRPLNSKATYSCTDGYRLRGESERSCQVNSMWSGTDPVCELIECPELNFVNGEVDITPSSRPLDAKATYKCSSGYNLLEGNSERFCQVNSKWNGTEPVCGTCYLKLRRKDNFVALNQAPPSILIQCPILSVDNGMVVIDPKQRPLNSKASYSCSEDYNLKGSGERFCQVDGTWSGIDIVCEKKSSALSAGTIAGIVIAVIVGVVAVGLVTTIGIVASVNACQTLVMASKETPKLV